MLRAKKMWKILLLSILLLAGCAAQRETMAERELRYQMLIKELIANPKMRAIIQYEIGVIEKQKRRNATMECPCPNCKSKAELTKIGDKEYIKCPECGWFETQADGSISACDPPKSVIWWFK